MIGKYGSHDVCPASAVASGAFRKQEKLVFVTLGELSLEDPFGNHLFAVIMHVRRSLLPL